MDILMGRPFEHLSPKVFVRNSANGRSNYHNPQKTRRIRRKKGGEEGSHLTIPYLGLEVVARKKAPNSKQEKRKEKKTQQIFVFVTSRN